MDPVVFFLALLVASATAANTADRVEGDVSGFTAEQAQVLVDRHNHFRSAEGATSMIKVVWDDEIAASAQGIADECKFGHMPWDERKLVGQYGGVGENLFATGSQSGFNTISPVDNWASEINFYHYDDNSCDEGKACGHYKQVVWDSLRAIGCGVKKCDSIIGWGPPGYVVFCQYGPPGNWIGQKPYDQGAKCSACPDFAPNCDAQYNLCTAEDGTSNPNTPTDTETDTDTTALECEDGWSEIEGKCYKYYSRKIPFADAVEACVEDGAILAMPKTDAIVQGLLGLKRNRWIWINIVAQATWSDGTPLDWTNWNEGEDDQKCAYINLREESQLWYYRDCTKTRKFFCQKDKSPSERRRRAQSDDDMEMVI